MVGVSGPARSGSRLLPGAACYPERYPGAEIGAFLKRAKALKLLKINGEPRWTRTSDPLSTVTVR